MNEELHLSFLFFKYKQALKETDIDHIENEEFKIKVHNG